MDRPLSCTLNEVGSDWGGPLAKKVHVLAYVAVLRTTEAGQWWMEAGRTLRKHIL